MFEAGEHLEVIVVAIRDESLPTRGKVSYSKPARLPKLFGGMGIIEGMRQGLSEVYTSLNSSGVSTFTDGKLTTQPIQVIVVAITDEDLPTGRCRIQSRG